MADVSHSNDVGAYPGGAGMVWRGTSAFVNLISKSRALCQRFANENKASRRPLGTEAAEKNCSSSLVSEHRINTMYCTCVVDSVKNKVDMRKVSPGN